MLVYLLRERAVIDKVIVDEHVIDGRNVDTKRAVPRSNANRSEGNARYIRIVHRIAYSTAVFLLRIQSNVSSSQCVNTKHSLHLLAHSLSHLCMH
jgi:hypothetical protein